MVDYRKILIAYMNVVGEFEGVDFLENGPKASLPGLTEEEAIELAKIRDINRVPERRFYKTSTSCIQSQG